MTVLAAEKLGKNYKARKVVNEVSLQITNGEVVGLLGPNGAGKTTCFYIMVGLVSADSGKVTFDGKDITHLPMHQRARLGIGYLPQEASVFRKLTVAENILAILQLRADLDRDQQNNVLEELLEELHITNIRDNTGLSLSGGERRRVEIARALAIEPKFILLDEPFAGVDPLSVNDIKQIIKHLQQRGIGILITDHNVRETLAICERAYILNAGHLIAQGSPQDVLADKKVREVYLGEDFYI